MPFTTSKYFPILSLYHLYVKQFRLAGGNRDKKELLLSVAYSDCELKFSKSLFQYFSQVMHSLKERWVDLQEKGFSSLPTNFESCVLFSLKSHVGLSILFLSTKRGGSSSEHAEY